MLVKKIKGLKVEFFDNIEELSMKRYELFTKYIMLSAGIGGDIDSANAHFSKLYAFIAKNDVDNLRKQLINFHQNIKFAIDGLQPENRAFAALVKSINGKQYLKMNDSVIDEILLVLEQKTKRVEVLETINSLKKKLISRLMYFSKN